MAAKWYNSLDTNSKEKPSFIWPKIQILRKIFNHVCHYLGFITIAGLCLNLWTAHTKKVNEKSAKHKNNLLRWLALVSAFNSNIVANFLFLNWKNEIFFYDWLLALCNLWFLFSFFLKIMNQKCGSYVCVQLLQTLNILFENIRNETSIYYLLSNNHVNSIIVHKFDFSDEEVMAYYISFLKTLSFR